MSKLRTFNKILHNKSDPRGLFLGRSPSIESDKQSFKVTMPSEVEKLKPLIYYGLNVYNLTSFETLFPLESQSKSKIYSSKGKNLKMNSIIDILRDKFLIERKESILLANFILSEGEAKTIDKEELLHKLWIFSEF